MNSSRILVKVAQTAVGRRGQTLTTLGLGSCVAILLHDAAAEVGGMAHVLLPEPFAGRPNPNPAKFATSAIPWLVEELESTGANPQRLRARLVGGASMFAALMTPNSLNMGERNVAASRDVLAQLGIPICGEDVGGDYGRSVRFNAGAGNVIVSTVGRGDRAL